MATMVNFMLGVFDHKPQSLLRTGEKSSPREADGTKAREKKSIYTQHLGSNRGKANRKAINLDDHNSRVVELWVIFIYSVYFLNG